MKEIYKEIEKLYKERKRTSLINKDSELKSEAEKLEEIKEMVSVFVQTRTGLAEEEIRGELKGYFFITGNLEGKIEGRKFPESFWQNITLYYEDFEREMIEKEIIQSLEKVIATYPLSGSKIKTKTQKVVSLLKEKNKRGKITTLDLITLNDCINEMLKEIDIVRKEINRLLRNF